MAKNLTLENRIQIQTMLDNKHRVTDIAQYIGCAFSTIYREIKKVVGGNIFYDAYTAHAIASNNMVRTSVQSPSKETITFVEQQLQEEWSPEQISNWLKVNHRPSVSHTWIYQYIEQDKAIGGKLHKRLRHGKYMPKDYEYKGKIPDRKPIEDRPAIVEARTRLGDYEVDLIVGIKNRGAILSIVDRTSRLCCLKKLNGKTAQEVEDAVVLSLLPYKGKLHTITSDNGDEFTNHLSIAKRLGIDYYFAQLYASYERGSVENLNGLVRQYIPKGTDFNEVEAYTVKWIEDRLNNRPRKVLGYRSPKEFVADIEQAA